MDKNKHRFNLIDVFVVFIVLAIIAGAVYYTFRETKDLQAQIRERNITYTLRLSGVNEEFLSSFEQGVHVLDSSTLDYIGTISKVRSEKMGEFTDKAVSNNLGSNYILAQKRYDDVYDVYLTITAKTMLDDRGVAYIDRQRITIGSLINVRCGNFPHEAYITYFSIN